MIIEMHRHIMATPQQTGFHFVSNMIVENITTIILYKAFISEEFYDYPMLCEPLEPVVTRDKK